ncbi:MAG: helix-turn-helix transcriptional regulator [Bacteroidetes bacterium]|nr:helix-turn-helix transcriptional regulator [Bacteroidota bacterium]
MSKKIEKAFGHVVRKLRVSKGLSQQELADRLSLYRHHISIIERGLNSPSMFLVFQIAYSLEVEPYQLMEMLEERLRLAN